MEVRGEYAGVLIDGPVLDYDIVAPGYVHDILEPLVEEINLEIEGPAFHVGVEIRQIRIEIDRLEFRGPTVMGCQHLGQSGLATTYVSCYSDMHILMIFNYFSIGKRPYSPASILSVIYSKSSGRLSKSRLSVSIVRTFPLYSEIHLS